MGQNVVDVGTDVDDVHYCGHEASEVGFSLQRDLWYACEVVASTSIPR